VELVGQKGTFSILQELFSPAEASSEKVEEKGEGRWDEGGKQVLL
jgi:hypothetical protein